MWLLISCPQSRTAPMQLTEDLGKKVLGSSLSLSSWDHSGLLSSGLVTYFSKSYSQVLCRRTLSKSSYGFSSLLPLLPYLGCKVFQVWLFKSCDHVDTHISKRAFTALFFVLWWPSGPRVMCVCDRNTEQEVWSCLVLSYLVGQVWHLLCSLLAWIRHKGVTTGFCSVLRMET